MVMAIENFKNYDQFFAILSNFDSLKTQNVYIVCSKSHFSYKNLLFPKRRLTS